MSIKSLTKAVRQKMQEGYTNEERALLLYDAKIVDDSGNYHTEYFREETINKAKKIGPIIDPVFLAKCLAERKSNATTR